MQNELTMSIRSKYGYDIVDIVGEISFDDFYKIDGFIKSSATPGNRHMILNMNGVKYINSSALSLLIKLMRELSMNKIELYIMNANEEIEGLMKITGVRKFFQLISDEATLMKKLQKDETDKLLDPAD